MTAVHHVHVDALEYTREGLRTRSPIRLQDGRHNRVVLVRPERVRPIANGARGFPNDLAFPLLATLSQGWALAPVGTPFTHHAAPVPRAAVYQVFGHASPSGDEEHNKTLSERRADVGMALLRSDGPALQALGEDEGWGVREYQSMLRTLALDPGPTDGKLGGHTKDALAVFVERYNAGVYHRRHGAEPSASLEATDGFDEATLVGLFDAFVHAHGGALPDSAIHPSHSASGCSEYNALTPNAGANDRRLTVLGHASLPEHHENAPCKRGDTSACAVLGGQHQRCMYYRDHVLEEPTPEVRFADLRWKYLGGDRYLLSAMTDLAGDADVLFDVFDATERARGEESVDATWVSEPRAEGLKGVILRGIAQVVWKSGASPIDAEGRPDFDAFPVFRVRDPETGVHAFAPWPETATLRVLVGSVVDVPEEFALRLVAGDGSHEREVSRSDAEPVSGTHDVVAFEGVPLDSRVSLYVGPVGSPGLPILVNAVAAGLGGNCSLGNGCTEIAIPEAPPDPAVPSEIDEDEDESNPWLEGDPEVFAEMTYEL